MLLWFLSLRGKPFSSILLICILLVGPALVQASGIGEEKITGLEDNLLYAENPGKAEITIKNNTKIYIVEGTVTSNLTTNTSLGITYVKPYKKGKEKIYVEKSHNKTKTEHKFNTTKKIKDIPLYVFYSSCPDDQSYSIFSGKHIAATAGNFHWVAINAGNEEVVSSHFGFEKTDKIPSKNESFETCKVPQNSSRAPPVC